MRVLIWKKWQVLLCISRVPLKCVNYCVSLMMCLCLVSPSLLSLFPLVQSSGGQKEVAGFCWCEITGLIFSLPDAKKA